MWWFIVPGVYFAGMFFTYWLIRATDAGNDADDKCTAAFWPFSLPFVLLGLVLAFFSYLLDLVDPWGK